MEAYICKHPKREHTVWYWVEDGDPVPVPRMAKFDNRVEAMTFAEDGIRQASEGANHLRWIKIFRSDNETYTCFFWENPDPWVEPAPPTPLLPSKKKRWWRR